MGCCSSSRAVTNTQSPVCGPDERAMSPDSGQINPGVSQLHQPTNAGHDDDSSDSSMPVSRSFAHNKSIAKEMLRLEEMEIGGNDIDEVLQKGNEQNPTDFKSNENSEDIPDSFGEAATRSVTVDDAKSPDYQKQKGEHAADSYTPFGLIEPRKTEVEHPRNQEVHEKDIKQPLEEEAPTPPKGEKVEDLAKDLEALYAENLKQHGFDANKFRTANISGTKEGDHRDHSIAAGKSESTDLSSFASSELSSKSGTLRSIKSSVTGAGSRNLNVEEFIAEEDDDDFILQELSRSAVHVFDANKMEGTNDRVESVGYIESFQQSVRDGGSMHNIMDDDDEELMDAILSLDMED